MTDGRIKPASGISAFSNMASSAGKNGSENQTVHSNGSSTSKSGLFSSGSKEAASYTSVLSGYEMSDQEMTSFIVMLEENNRRIMEYLVRDDDSADKITMPSLLGMAVGEATVKIKSCGLKASKISYRSHPRIASGLIISQIPVPGSLIGHDVEIHLTVCRNKGSTP